MSNVDLNSFTYASQPHSAPSKASKRYRNPNDATLTLMSDPRVVRGSTHSLARKVTLSKAELSKSQQLASSRKIITGPDQLPQPTYTFEVKPFSNDEIDVSMYLIQQTETRPQKRGLDTQTDEFIHRPDTPEYVPAKVGVDIGTQVEDVRELFDFNAEVVPLVEVIVQKTIDQALFELGSEEELSNLEQAARDFRAEKFDGDEWMRIREDQAILENRQRRERIQALQTARENEKKTKTIIAGIQMMRQTFPHALDSIFSELFQSGHWTETDDAVVQREVVPVIVQGAQNFVLAHAVAAQELDGKYLDFLLFLS
jgi:radial spoke head protein 3